MHANLRFTDVVGNIFRLRFRRDRTNLAARAAVVLVLFTSTKAAMAFRVLDVSGFGVVRWNAAPHFVDGVERSLDGGLRYSLSGGSYAAFRDAFSWEGTPPSVPEFQSAVEQAFAAWEATDPATGLRTDLRFVPDFDTPVFAETLPQQPSDFDRLNRGAEIDLLAVPRPEFPPSFFAASLLYGDPDPDANSVTLTSSVSNYPAAIPSGVDIYMNISRTWQLEVFQDSLTHEIGHAIGLADLDVSHDDVRSRFYDDNYDDTSSATALATLTNSFANLIDPLDPDNSPGLMLYDVCTGFKPWDPLFSCKGDPGIDTPGVDLLMEATPNTGFPPRYPSGLQNDEFAGRQFLYPYSVSCDFNGDQFCDGTDIDQLMIDAATGGTETDLNRDGIVDNTDRDRWLALAGEENGLAGPLLVGDSDTNGTVDAIDLNALALSWQEPDDHNWTSGNFSVTGGPGVNAGDLNALALNWRASSVAAAASQAVPEPSGIGPLLAAAMGWLMFHGRISSR